MNSFTRSIDLLQREMDVTSLRYQVTANNLANSEVPNFKRSTVNFESELKRAFESEEKAKNGLNQRFLILISYHKVDKKSVQKLAYMGFVRILKSLILSIL